MKKEFENFCYPYIFPEINHKIRKFREEFEKKIPKEDVELPVKNKVHSFRLTTEA